MTLPYVSVILNFVSATILPKNTDIAIKNLAEDIKRTIQQGTLHAAHKREEGINKPAT